MAVYHIEDKSIKVLGDAVRGFIRGLDVFEKIGLEILGKYDLDNPRLGEWYSLENYLKAHQELEQKLGSAALFALGQKVQENAVFPPEIESIEKALASIDIAYHMNHGVNGNPMIDLVTGKMMDGIGNYSCQKIEDGKIEIVADNPYPTAFDEGLILSIAQRFNPISVVQLVEERSSRSKGGNADVFLVQWF